MRSWKVRLFAAALIAAAAMGLAALQPPSDPSPAAALVLHATGDEARTADGWASGGDQAPLPLFSAQPLPLPAVPASALRNRGLVLCWHTFLGKPGISTDFSLAELGAQLDAIKALGFRFVDLRDLLAGRIEGPLNVAVTIDDGHRTIPGAVEKVLLPRGIRPTLFIYPAIIGNVPYAMTEDEVRRLAAEGCAIGAHGYHHLFINENLYRTDRASFNEEIYKAKARTERLYGLPILLFAYPYGAYSPITLSEVAKAGYFFGLAVKSGFVYAEAGLNSDYELPRLVVTRDKWTDILALLKREVAQEAALR
jgi:peptidoglycan/xylan/chitin deacetylase (PgdA/CDA1 family)